MKYKNKMKNYINKELNYYIDLTYGDGKHTKYMLDNISKKSKIFTFEINKKYIEKTKKISLFNLNKCNTYIKNIRLKKQIYFIIMDIGYTKIQIKNNDYINRDTYAKKIGYVINNKAELEKIFTHNKSLTKKIIGNNMQIKGKIGIEGFENNLTKIVSPQNKKNKYTPNTKYMCAIRKYINKENIRLITVNKIMNNILNINTVNMVITFNKDNNNIIRNSGNYIANTFKSEQKEYYFQKQIIFSKLYIFRKKKT